METEYKNINEKLKLIDKECINKSIILTRSIFLKSMAAIYLFAFLSLYFQIQGLWGEEGLLPVENLLKKLQENLKDQVTFFNFPALIWFHKSINFYFLKALSFIGLQSYFTNSSSIDNSLYILCLFGIIVSTSILLNVKWAYNPFGFFLIWFIYLNFFIIGQTFMSFQWDIFLLETGFLTIWFCPIWISRMIIITPVDNLVYYMIRFLMFRFIYSNGIVKLSANCPAWLSFNALHHHFQSQPLPNLFSYYAHFLPDGIKKMLVAETFFIEIYAAFLFFSYFRIISIFGGLLQFCLQFGIILTGNYNFFNLLTLIVNLSNFDDQFLRSFLPETLLELFQLDPLSDVKSYMRNQQGNINNDNNTADAQQATPLEKETDSSSNKEDIKEILKNRRLRKIYDSHIISESDHLFKTNGIWVETITFYNILAVSILITFFYFYPLKELLPGNLRTSTKHIKGVYDNTFMNAYLIFIFLYISICYIANILSVLSKNLFVNLSLETMSDMKEKKDGLIWSILDIFLSLFSLFKYFVVFIFFILHYLHSWNIFYQSVDLKFYEKDSKKFIDKYLEQGVNLSDYLFTRFRICHGYGLFRVMTGVGGRPELEIKIFDQEKNSWDTLEFLYKMSDKENFHFKTNIPHQPRVDWQIWFSSLAKDINSEPWLVIMLGKILEKNPVTLDLLGYHIEQKEFYYKYSLFDQLSSFLIHRNQRQKLSFIPKKIKIESYTYFFSSKKEDIKKGKFWYKKYVKDFLPPIEKSALLGIFDMYGLPKINERRKIQISPFQQIPIIDILIFIWICLICYRFWIKKR